MTSRILGTAGLSGVLATVVACAGSDGAPSLDPMDPQTATVGSELSITLRATDPEGDPLSFTFDSQIRGIHDRAQLTRAPDGAAVWRWTPLAADVGTWYVDFTVSDGTSSTTETVEVDVGSAAAGAGVPVFRQPLGSGTTLDLATQSCIDLPIVVDDQDSTSVTITEQAPRIDGATLTATGAMSATWHWCPSDAQIAAADPRYTLTLGADDGDHPTVLKTYLVVLQSAGGGGCVDDAHEPDDDAATARPTTYPTFTSTGNTICTSDDWYWVPLYNSEHLTVDLTFVQNNSMQDLDLHLINHNGTDLTPCHESNPATCTAQDGQGAQSNEHYEYTAPQSGCATGCDYYVVVHGFNGSQNTYDIAISIQ